MDFGSIIPFTLFSKFSAPSIAFLTFWLAKKLWLWANSQSFTWYGKYCAKFKKFLLCKIVEIKIGGKTGFENFLKQLFHLPLLGGIWSDYNQLALRARWLFYHFISNSGSWNNCYIACDRAKPSCRVGGGGGEGEWTVLYGRKRGRTCAFI